MEEAAACGSLRQWPAACAVRATLQVLQEDCASQHRLLEHVKQHLQLSSSAHAPFVQAGGVQVLCSFLSSSSSATQNNCMGALEALALNEDVRSDLLETVLAEKMFHTVRTNRPRRGSSIRQKAGTIIKLLAGWQPRGFVGAVSSAELNSARASGGLVTPHRHRDRPYPLWCYTTCPMLPWEAEAVSCLVEILSTDLGRDVQETSERVIQKILRERKASGPIILKKRDMANLVGVISSMHSSAIIAMEAVTITCIMHPSNEITFARTGGFESLLQAIRSDNIGNICGEMAAWAIAYFALRSVDNCLKIVNSGGAEALVELLHSPDKCAREASARACVVLLRNLGKSNHAIRQKFGDANAIPALLSALRDGQSQGQPESIMLDILWTLMDMARAKEHRKEILDAGGLETLKESATGSGAIIQDATKKLSRVLLSKSARLRLTMGSVRMNCRFIQMMARRLGRLFCYRANVDRRKSRGNDITDWACGNIPVHPFVFSSTIQAEQLARSPRLANSTVSLTSFGVKMYASNPAQPLETQSSITPGDSHKHTETASFKKHDCPVNFEAKNECRESDAQTSVCSPSMQDLAVVVVTLTTQSSMLSDSQHHGNFMDSSQSNLIATRDFI